MSKYVSPAEFTNMSGPDLYAAYDRCRVRMRNAARLGSDDAYANAALYAKRIDREIRERIESGDE